MRIIGLSGTNGSGKDSVGHFLAEKHNFFFVSVSDLLREECRRRGLEVMRENLRMVSGEWRREFGLGVLVDKAIEACKQTGQEYAGVVVCPMRNVGEAQHLKDLGGTLVWIDAKPELRYERVIGANRGRAGEDDKTYEQFLAEQEAEMYPSDPNDPSVLNMAGVRELADVKLLNEADMTDVQEDVEVALHLA